MIIDVHTHAWPDKIAGKAREYLEGLFHTKMAAVPTVDNLMRFMDINGVDVSVVNSVATRPEQVASINNWLFGIKSERIKVFAALHPKLAGWRDELMRIRDNASGIKMQPEFQDFYIDDEAMYPIYEMMAEYGLPVLFHCGEELSGTMLVRSSPERVRKVTDRFPDLKMIAAHFGGFRMWEDVEKYLVGRGIYLDTAFTFGHMDRHKLESDLKKHPKELLLFGTDFPLVDQKKDIDYLNNMDIDESLKRRIFSENALSLLP